MQSPSTLTTAEGAKQPRATSTAVAGTSPARTASIPADVNEGRLLVTLGATILLVYTNVSLLAPLLVAMAADFHTSVGTMGQLAAAAAIPWALLAPFMGMLADRYGRRLVLAAGTALLGATTVLSATAWSFGSLFALRVLCGVGGAAAGPNLLSSPSEYFPPARQGRAGGIILGGNSLATVVGVPVVAYIAAYVGWRWAFSGVGLLLVLMGVVVWRALPATPTMVSRQSHISSLAGALAEPSSRFLLASNLMERVSFNVVGTYLAAYLIQSYALRLEQAAPILSGIAVGTFVGSIAGGRLADRGKQMTYYAAFEAVSALIALAIFATHPGVVATAMLAATFGLFSAMARPLWLWLISRVPAPRRGATMGFATLTNQTGMIIGALTGGFLVSLAGYTPLGFLACSASLLAAITCSTGAKSLSRGG